MLSILLIYLLLLSAIFVWQRNLVYFPAIYSLANLSQQANRSGLKPWPSENNYLGLAEKTGNAPSKGTIIVFHGNAGSAIDRTYLSSPLTELGYRVVLAEYPGYGARTGAPSEQTLISDGITTVKLALADFGCPIFLWGESLGGGAVGGIIKSEQIPVKGIVLATPFSGCPTSPSIITGFSWPSG